MAKTTCEKYKEAWKLKRNEYSCGGKKFYSYVSEADEKAFKPNQHLFFYYQTHILPQPFFGNIENPEIVILALNPKYSPFYSENELMDVFDFSGEKDYISDDEMEQYIKNPNIIFTEKSHTKQWWENNVFNGLEYSSIEAILDNVAIFNLCGYHSLEYKPLPNDILADNYFKLPTQSALKEHLAFLLSQKNIQIIKIWGTEWEEFLEQIEQKVKNDTVKHSNFMENISNILVVNGMNRRNKKIKNALKSPSNIEVMFKNFEKKKS